MPTASAGSFRMWLPHHASLDVACECGTRGNRICENNRRACGPQMRAGDWKSRNYQIDVPQHNHEVAKVMVMMVAARGL